MKLFPFKTDPNNKLLYSDTDSIVMVKPIHKSLISSTDIDKFKFEHEIVEAYFISENFLCLY